MREDDIRAKAQAFADALDRNDFGTVAGMLAPDCRYQTGASFTSEGTLVGPDAIVASYRQHDGRSRRLFDSVEYSSVVEDVDGTEVTIRFIDVLEKAGAKHSHSCRQRLSLDRELRIKTIVQDDIATEVLALRAFLERAGIAL